MAKFDIILQAPQHIMEAGDDIHTRYFTIDTADLITFYEWYAHNPNIVVYACLNDKTVGYYNIIPITKECAHLLDQQALKEEDMQIEHILSAEAMPYAQYLYIASIAIHDRQDYTNRQCVAALISSIADHILVGYDTSRLKRIYANPTTFNGNKLVRRLGLKPLVSFKKPLKGNDIYALDINAETIEKLRTVSSLYSRFIGKTPWK